MRLEPNTAELTVFDTCTGFDTRAFQVNGTIQVGKDYEDGKAILIETAKWERGRMICETCRFHPDCDLEPPEDDETCPYFEPKQRLRLTFTEAGWKMGEV